MSGDDAAPVWRLKVINGCNFNNDVMLPTKPQPLLLEQFYNDLYEYVDYSRIIDIAPHEELKNNRKNRGRGRYKTPSKNQGTHSAFRITKNEWVQKIAHISMGRHTFLPTSLRLRHASVSRLQCRIVYINNNLLHKRITTIFTLVKKYERGTGKGDCVSLNGFEPDIAFATYGKDDELPSFEEPYYCVINYGSNPLYVNSKQVPRGCACPLDEGDIISFLENPFDEEGGILEPLLPSQKQGPHDSDEERSICSNKRSGIIREKKPPEATTGGYGLRHSFQTLPEHSNGDGGTLHPTFVEVAGRRIARYRPAAVASDLHHSFATVNGGEHTYCGFSSTDSTPPKPNDLSSLKFQEITTKVKEEGDDAMKAEYRLHGTTHSRRSSNDFITSWLVPNGVFTPTKRSKPSDNGFYGGDGYALDVSGDDVSPLRPHVLPSTPERCSGSREQIARGAESNADSTKPHILIPPQLPVYLFARRSPSPVEVTHSSRCAVSRNKPNTLQDCSKRSSSRRSGGGSGVSNMAGMWVDRTSRDSLSTRKRKRT
uniref:Uncharacterized protein n=1 Tax=Trypanosoma congolense (strain IL3000) TaxID=1068625 RepID=G0UVX9_TRYCI|nr:conserved hypothetical protein [Trypanosoma congolense IL3000]